MIKNIVLPVLLLLWPAQALAQHREPDGEILLWPNAPAPGSEALIGELEEIIVERSPEPDVIRDRYVAQITQPRLQVFRPENPNGSALLMIPGGGYQRVVLDKEGYESAEALNEDGVTVFVLIYRLPHEGHENSRDVPLQDAQRAMRVIRSQADEYSVDPDRVGVIGFSAGGHVAGSLTTRFDADVYAPRDSADTLSARPDASMLMYAVTRLSGPAVHEGSRDRLVGPDPSQETLAVYDIAEAARADAPPLFILHAINDTSVPLPNGLDVFNAFMDLGAPVELHVFDTGGHGFGIRHTTGLPVAAWPDMVSAWMARHGLMGEAAAD